MFKFFGVLFMTTILTTNVFAGEVNVQQPTNQSQPQSETSTIQGTEQTPLISEEDSKLIVADAPFPQPEKNSIQLPFPNKLNTTALMYALNMRKSEKSFIEKDIDDNILSSLLWAAYGVNRTTGERTIPTAMNKKDLSIYLFKKDGIFKYDGLTHSLIPVLKEDKRSIFNTQDYMKNVPVILVYTGSNEDYASMHAGSAYQNVSLFAVAHKMACVVRGFFDKEVVKSTLNLPEGERVIISQAIGYKE